MITLNGEPIRIKTSRLVLRPLRVEDVSDEYIAGMNLPSVTEYLVNARLVPQTRDTVTSYVTRNRADPAAILFGLFLADGRLIGTVRVHSIEPVHGTAVVGVCVFLPMHWGRGYSSEAIAAVSEWTFAHLPVRYLEAGCYEANEASVKAFLKAGFSVAARFTDKYLHNGQPAAVVFLRRLAPSGSPLRDYP